MTDAGCLFKRRRKKASVDFVYCNGADYDLAKMKYLVLRILRMGLSQ